MRFSICFAALVAGALPAQIVATVNDARSHGTLGDTRLSLDEAIRLANGTLATSALSAQEVAQLSGLSGFVGRIEIPAASVPRITLERVLTDVIGQHHSHLDVEIEGISGPAGAPVLDGGSFAITLPVRTNHAHIHNVVIHGGLIGIEYDTTLHVHTGAVAEIGEVTIEHAHDVGLRVVNPTASGSVAPIALHEVHIHGSDIGIEIVDTSPNGNTDVQCLHVAIAECDVGVRMQLDSTGPTDNLVQFMHSRIDAANHCVLTNRIAASDSRWRLRFVHGSYHSFDRAFELQTGTGRTSLELHHLDVRGGVLDTSYAVLTGPQSGHLSLLATDCVFTTPMQLAAGTATSALRLHNNRLAAGALALSLTAGNAAFEWCNFTAYPVTIAAASGALTSPISFATCEFVRSDVNDRSPGRSALDGCFLGGSALSGNVQSVRAQLTPWMGTAAITPQDPPVGGFVDLTTDLHPGAFAAWMLGPENPDPITTAMPFRFYFNPVNAVTLPGLQALHSRTRLRVPTVNALRGARVYLQPVQVIPLAQQQAPSVYLPTGAVVEIQ